MDHTAASDSVGDGTAGRSLDVPAEGMAPGGMTVGSRPERSGSAAVAAGGRGKVLVTGASGHLGANLIRRLLADGEEVRVLLVEGHNNEGVRGLDLETVHGDLRDPTSTRAAVRGCRRVYHCAARVSTIYGTARHKREIFEINVRGTRNLLRAAAECGVERVVASGSFSAIGYDLDDPSRPADESGLFYPFHRAMPYEHSKVLMEQECLRAVVADGMDVVIAVSCAIVGPNDFWPSRLGRTICDFARGKLKRYIPGGFEFVAARDIVEGHVLAMAKGRPGHRYIFSSEFKTIDDMVALFEEVTGRPRPLLRLPAGVMLPFSEVASFYLSRLHPHVNQRFTPGAIRLLRQRRRADIGKAGAELGYRPTSIRDAVIEAYEFHRARGAIRDRRRSVAIGRHPLPDAGEWSPRPPAGVGASRVQR